MPVDTRQLGPRIAPLKYRPDWPEAARRLTALWQRQNTDRPGLDIRVRRPGPAAWPAKPKSPADLYFDPEYTERSWLALFESTHFLGEAVPTGPFFLGGYALGCGPDVVFAEDTVWHPRLMTSPDGPANWRPGPADPWRQRLDRLLGRLMAAAPGKFLVGGAMQVPLNDLLPLLRGVPDFLTELADDTGRAVGLLQRTWPAWYEIFRHYLDLMLSQRQGCTWGWPGLWHPGVLVPTQSDISCMISGELFDRYVLPEMDLLGERFYFVWYHLDGSGAVRHLPRLLGRPYIRAIQYVPSCDDPPNGPGLMHLYQQVQSAGRCLDLAVPWENVEYLIRHLRPEGLLLRTTAPSLEAAKQLLANAPAWSGSQCLL